jgi:lipopolysaccharide assembly outer membrane protein LptD (OstA)
MKSKFMVFAALTGILATTPALAAGLNYTYVDLQYDSLSAGGGISGTGFAVDASYDFAPNWGIVGSYASNDVNTGVTVTPFTLGVGYHRDMGGWDILGQVRYYGITNNVGFDVSGYVASVGGRVAVSPQFEVQGMVGTDRWR